MGNQRSIPSHKVTRALALAGSGAKIGGNYLRYHARRAITGNDDRTDLHAANASDSYAVLSRLKGAPLKVAQMLSIDQNLLPEPYAREYAKAQYSAPPLSFPLVVNTFRKVFGKAPEAVFDRFEKQAVSGASIGQIHRAWKGKQAFAVKVQYPGVADSLLSDLRLIRPIAMRLFDLKAAELDYYMDEVQARLLEETDYELELRRSIELSAASAGILGVRFPKYFPQYSGRRILTMEWMNGVTLDRFADECDCAETRNQVGQALWDFYHFQIHSLKVFHADPHPGNFLVEDGILQVLDFGCVKEIPEDFHAAYFRLLDPAWVENSGRFERALRDLSLLLPTDRPEDESLLIDLYRESVELLGEPFRSETFDFGNPSYLERIRHFGEQTSQDRRLKRLNSARGSRHALYVNRAYFGLYGLMARLRARVRAGSPVIAESLSGVA